jgi:hypothetical protein
MNRHGLTRCCNRFYIDAVVECKVTSKDLTNYHKVLIEYISIFDDGELKASG